MYEYELGYNEIFFFSDVTARRQPIWMANNTSVHSHWLY